MMAFTESNDVDAKSKLYNELELKGMFLQNDVRHINTSTHSLVPDIDGRAGRTPGFSCLRMREVNYFHCSIILHSDVAYLLFSINTSSHSIVE